MQGRIHTGDTAGETGTAAGISRIGKVDMVRIKKMHENQSNTIYLPEREQISRYAEAFYSLAKLFQDLPCQKERLGDSDLEQLFEEVKKQACAECACTQGCWKQNYFQSSRMLYEVLNDLEYDGTVSAEILDWMEGQCERPVQVADAMSECYSAARQTLLWNNRMMEQRMAAGEQIFQTARLLQRMTEGFASAPEREQKLWKKLKRELRAFSVELRDIRIFVCDGSRTEIYLTLCAGKRTCISVKSIAEILSECCYEKMRPAWNCRAAVGEEAAVFHFVPETKFQICCGIARITKSGEMVSGDNFAFLQKETGKVVMSLADGMGSGVEACRESERVIELLEQFLEAGFPQETAVRMINSCMLLHSSSQMFSTIDLCMVDLYNATCDLIKSGASSTFIKCGNEIEVIRSQAFPTGVMQQSDYESMHRCLKPGSSVIMMTDGVLEALPERDRERLMAELIGKCASHSAREFAQRLMERVYLMQKLHAQDDMTILVGNLWEK